jgi:hypothetical protein
MPKRREDDDEQWVALATRIPKPLHRALRVECVKLETSVQLFVVDALREKLLRVSGRRRA